MLNEESEIKFIRANSYKICRPTSINFREITNLIICYIQLIKENS